MCMFANGPFAQILSLFMNIYFTNRICSWWSTKRSILSHVLAVLIAVNDAKFHSGTHSSGCLILFPLLGLFSVVVAVYPPTHPHPSRLMYFPPWFLEKELYFGRKYGIFVGIFSVKMGRRVCVKSKALALIRQFDCFSFEGKEDSNWAWSESLVSFARYQQVVA